MTSTPTSPSPEPGRWTRDQVEALGLITDVPTAASVLGVGRSTAYDLIRRGDFPVPVVRLGTRLRVPTDPLLVFLETGDPTGPSGRAR